MLAQRRLLGDYWVGSSKLHRATAQTLCSENPARKEAVTRKTETLLYVLPGILYIGALEGCVTFLYPVHLKLALIYLKAQIMTHSVMFLFETSAS